MNKYMTLFGDVLIHTILCAPMTAWTWTNRQVHSDMYVITVKQSGCERACVSSYFIDVFRRFCKISKSDY